MSALVSPLITNRWYVAGLSREIGRTPLGRTLVGQPVVLFRTEAGAPVALLDACAHRQYPLSHGQLVGDRIQCGYHGFQFSAQGQCEFIPSTKRIPRNSSVLSFKLVERGGLVWIWIGDEDRADKALIPDTSHFEVGSNTSEYNSLDANYQLLIENLLDFSHVTFVHADQQGHAKLAEVVPEARVEGNRVISSRVMPDATVPPLWHRIMKLPLGAPMSLEQNFEFNAPSAVFVKQRLKCAEDTRTFEFSTNHFATPDGFGQTHYWWVICLHWDGLDEGTMRLLHEGGVAVALQDKPVIEAQQKRLNMLQGGSVPVADSLLNIPFDAGALLSRQVLKRLAEANSQQAR